MVLERFMNGFDFSVLYSHYPEIIREMPNEFTSHSFILRLAQQFQPSYIEALFAYRNSTHREVPAPFMIVHGFLAKGLRQFPELVEYVGEVSSIDIFGQSNNCSLWRRLRGT
jgi:hypothetical protein